MLDSWISFSLSSWRKYHCSVRTQRHFKVWKETTRLEFSDFTLPSDRHRECVWTTFIPHWHGFQGKKSNCLRRWNRSKLSKCMWAVVPSSIIPLNPTPFLYDCCILSLSSVDLQTLTSQRISFLRWLVNDVWTTQNRTGMQWRLVAILIPYRLK